MPGRRNPKWIALGVVALCLGGLLSYVIYARVATETTVVAVAHTVYRGEVIERDDLTTVTLHGSSVAQAVPARELDNLVGQRAAFDLAAGSVVAPRPSRPRPSPPSGRAVVGSEAGHRPGARQPAAAVVRPSAWSRCRRDGTAARDKLAGDAFVGRVIDQPPGADGASILVNVDVAAAQAPTIALLAAQDRIAVVRDAGR